MESHGVIVKYSQMEDGRTAEHSCSGVYLGNGIVLTHATLLVDLLTDKRAKPVLQQLSTEGFSARLQHPSILDFALTSVQGKCTVILPSMNSARNTFCTDCDRCNLSALEPKKSYSESSNSIQDFNVLSNTESHKSFSVAATIDRIFLQHGIKQSLEHLMPSSRGWTLIEEDEKLIPSGQQTLIMSSFVLLIFSRSGQIQWTNEDNNRNVMQTMSEVLSCCVSIHKGNFIYIESSPFGSASPDIFLNSLSHGIVCNTSPEGGEVLLSDARCIMGCEGAPAFVMISEQRHLCAMVMTPFCWQEGEWLGLTLLAALTPVLQSLLHSYNSKKITQTITRLPNNTGTSTNKNERKLVATNILQENTVEKISSSVVCITCGEGWGSGVVVSTSPGLLLTCAHVVNKAIDKLVTVTLSDGRKMQGKVIHQTRPLITSWGGHRPLPTGYSMWDLAVVATSSSLPHSLSLSTSLPPQGAGVVVAGYGLFPPRNLPSATFSRGVIAKVITHPSSSLHLPSTPDSKGSTERKIDAGTNVPSKRDNINHHNCITRKASDDGGKATQKLMQQDSYMSDEGVDKSVAVPVVMQTTSAVYSGGSGGPVIAKHPSYGLQVVGIVVCNMQEDSSNVTHPNFNLAVPSPVIASIINTFLNTGDEAVLRYLDVECWAATHLWGLTHPSHSRL